MALNGELTIDLEAIVANWRALDALSAPAVETAAVVKADAYGCGVRQVGAALANAGARTFFAGLDQALRLALKPFMKSTAFLVMFGAVALVSLPGIRRRRRKDSR